MSIRRFVLLAAIVGGLGQALETPTAAQPSNAASPLEKTTAVSCEFRAMSTGEWKEGQTLAVPKAAALTLGFDEVNADEGTARAVGTFGASPIILRYVGGALHFLQTFTAGALYVTSIFPAPTREGRWMAVHTRHEYTAVSLPGFTSRPEQYYGDCVLRP